MTITDNAGPVFGRKLAQPRAELGGELKKGTDRVAFRNGRTI
jgi:hypothetical protein